MGQLATQAQNAQMQPMNPQQNMKSLLERSWPRIAAVIGNNLSPQRLYQMYVSTINREPQLANCSVESVLSCFMKCAALGLEPSNVDGLGRAYILPLREQELPHRPEGSHTHHRLQGHDRPRTPQRPDQGHQRPSSP